MPKNVPGSFTPLPTVKHSSGYQFQQRGGRVYVEDEEGNEITSIKPGKLQNTVNWEPIYLTARQLQTVAREWLAENLEA